MTALFRKIRTGSLDLERVQSSVLDGLNTLRRQLFAKPIVDGVLIEDIQMTNGVDEVIEHGLGRAPKGWIVVRSTAFTTYIDKQATNPTPEQTLIIEPSSSPVISLWVF